MKKTWHIEDVSDRAIESKYTFYLPSKEVIKKLEPGNSVKLIFLFESDDPSHPRAERMWVKITEISEGNFKGSLDNDPYFIRDVKYKDPVMFRLEHIIDTDIEDPIPSIVEKYVDRCLATRRVVDEHAKVKYIYRDESMGELEDGIMDTGWRILAGDETQEYLDDPENSIFVSVGAILNIDETVLPLLDEKIGAAFDWDDEIGQFVKSE